jgi:hypothetical protein
VISAWEAVIRSSRLNDAMADLPPGLQAEKQRMLERLHGSDGGLVAKTILLSMTTRAISLL